MKPYEPGPGNVKDLNKKLKEYRDIERQIDQAIQEKYRELVRISNAKSKLKRRATYEPSNEAWAYWEKNAVRIAKMPRPVHGGPAGLRRAAAEMEAHEQAKRDAA